MLTSGPAFRDVVKTGCRTMTVCSQNLIIFKVFHAGWGKKRSAFLALILGFLLPAVVCTF